MIKLRISLLLIVTCVLSLVMPNFANAHSGLERANPSAGADVDKVKRIELAFSTKIENLSTLYLIAENGTKLDPVSTKVTDNVLIATYKEPLEPGTYKVNWNIVGADGHPIEGNYSFNVIESNTTEPNSETNQDEKKNDDEKNNTKNKSNNKHTELSSSEDTSSSDENSLTTIIIIVLVVATIGILAWLFIGKRKK